MRKSALKPLNLHPSVFLTTYPGHRHRRGGACPNCHRASGGTHPRQIFSPELKPLRSMLSLLLTYDTLTLLHPSISLRVRARGRTEIVTNYDLNLRGLKSTLFAVLLPLKRVNPDIFFVVFSQVSFNIFLYVFTLFCSCQTILNYWGI